MKVGTKSLLFGVHQVFWHPFVVCRAWKHLYGRPSFKEFVCIFVHDWGYWGKPNLDGEEGVKHPALGARIAKKLFGQAYWRLCAGHSRSYIYIMNKSIYWIEPSKLCWADKLSFCYEPWWFYIFRAKLSGELKEIRKNYDMPGASSNRMWFLLTKDKIADIPEIKELLNKSHK